MPNKYVHSRYLKEPIVCSDNTVAYTSPLHYVVAWNNKADLSSLSPTDDYPDGGFCLTTDEGIIAKLGTTGMIQSVHHRQDVKPKRYSNRSNIISLKPILSRSNAYGYFMSHDNERDVGQIIDGIYEIIGSLKFRHEQEAMSSSEFRSYKWMKQLFRWRYETMLARFKAFGQLVGDSDIIADFNDNMVIGTVSKGCKNSCSYCCEGGNLTLYSLDQIMENFAMARSFEKEFHGSHLGLMDEGFINGSDLLYHHLYGGTDPRKIASLFNATFPELRKIYAFVGTRSVLDERTTDKYLRQLFSNANLVNRLLIGFETMHDDFSLLLGKPETWQMKTEAYRKLVGAGFKVKPIVQAAHGKKVVLDGREWDMEEIYDVTADRLASMMSNSYLNRQGKLQVSKFKLIPKTRIAKKFKDGTIQQFADEEEKQRSYDSFVAKLRSRGIPVEENYHVALEGRIKE